MSSNYVLLARIMLVVREVSIQLFVGHTSIHRRSHLVGNHDTEEFPPWLPAFGYSEWGRNSTYPHDPDQP